MVTPSGAARLAEGHLVPDLLAGGGLLPTGTAARVVVAAPASGHGKTTVATGLMAAFAKRGLAVSPHKVGPDYIDPGYHALATGRPGRNLDPFLCGEQRIAPLFLHGARGADVAIVEGVMGLYDGACGRGDFASTAHVAKLLGAPVVLVVDAAAQGRSVAALLCGFASYDAEVRIGGVILNRVGSERHEQILRDAVSSVGLAVLGVLPRDDRIAAPSRHLGLVPAAERSSQAVATVEALGDLVARCCDLDAILGLARSAPPIARAAWDAEAALAEPASTPTTLPAPAEVDRVPRPPDRPAPDLSDQNGPEAGEPDRLRPGRLGKTARPRVALAAGPAFTFSYTETAELLGAAGAELVTVDPLHDEALPEGTRALVVGGGFPEVYAAELASNDRLRTEVAGLAASGGVLAAECAGLLYLGRSLDGAPMSGILDLDARMTSQLALGYREAVAASDSVLARRGEAVRGHEFHRTACDPGAGTHAAWTWDGRREGFVHNGVHASYLHLHWAGCPRLARRLVEAVQ